ncbi:hypothetical protein [Methanococcoides alaskense]|uniref:Uncharacterized protein n=1 Tax=Methanococcoides alaskense TaxID=325778 RepID=A0AA90TY97_9EURY|nr:hypothetical protein [Methanococcoides alaskense]MDA0524566.1 hypothetical protein [Methanococcoides alaskense]MDR6222254.1 hypothetical protein [Methanococcoides alaskense]
MLVILAGFASLVDFHNFGLQEPPLADLGSENLFIEAHAPDVLDKYPVYRVLNEGVIHEENSNLYRIRSSVPDEEEAKELANAYLISIDELPNDSYIDGVDACQIEYLDHETGSVDPERAEPMFMKVSYSRLIDGYQVVGPGDSITVCFGDDGEVLSFFKTWRELERSGDVAIVPVEVAIKRLNDGNGVLSSANVYRVHNVDERQVGYFSDISGADQEFYYPVWVFKGTDSCGNPAEKYVSATEEIYQQAVGTEIEFPIDGFYYSLDEEELIV